MSEDPLRPTRCAGTPIESMKSLVFQCCVASRSTNNIDVPQQAACRIHTPTDSTAR